jgi:hypothetical protein
MSNELDEVKKDLTAERDRYRLDAQKAKTQPSTSPAAEDAVAKWFRDHGMRRRKPA